MKQLTQKMKSGEMQVLDVPAPVARKGMLLVRNFYSVISTGTEASTVKTARKGIIGKAKEKPQQVKKVIDALKNQGPVQTYRTVMNKLNAYSPLGYSSVGEVIDMAPDVNGFHIGDLVACGGSSASHAELVAVPVNLSVKLSFGKEKALRNSEELEKLLKAAAYNTLGAIAMQGVRQADLQLGETCAVIGLGLLGHLTATLLKASGVKTVGIDIDQAMVKLGQKHCLDLVLVRDNPSIEKKIIDFTEGIGCDAVIIAAATDSLDPINFAGAISRKKGTIVVVGAVPTGFDRDPHFFKKELSVKMSCSYGPGRYDPEYEEKGHDYPVGYVRWTEKRNMQAFQKLIYQGKININYLTTHVFKLKDAPKAYDMIIEKSESFLGIMIEYEREKKIEKNKVDVKIEANNKLSAILIGFIGAGSYAQSQLLPNIPKGKNVILKGVMDSNSINARSVAERYGFEFCTGQEDKILKNSEINTVFIATRHDSHGYYVKKALEAGKHVFIEKPLCLKVQELKEITELIKQQAKRKKHTILMVGYNRRFSPLTEILKRKIGTGTVAMIYRINAGAISTDSWIQDKEIGGGRILGEVCHFVDYLTFISQSLPVSVYAVAMDDCQDHNDTLTVSLRYQNGSIGSIQYFANGSKSLKKEYVEIYRHGMIAIINDFKELNIHGVAKPFRKKLMIQDKGQKNEMSAFINSILTGESCPIPPEEIFNAAEVTFKIIESLRNGRVMELL